MHKHIKRIVIILLAFAVLLPTFPEGWVEEAKASAQSGCEKAYFTSKGRTLPLEVQQLGTPMCNTKGLPFNEQYWKDKGLTVYGSAEIVPSNDFKPTNGGYFEKNGVRGEYRYIGYDRAGEKHSNKGFPNDATSGRPPEDKKWIYRSWDTNLPVPNKKSQASPILRNKFGPLLDRIVSNQDKTRISRLFDTGFRISFSTNSDDLEKNFFNYMYLQSPPTIRGPGNGVMWHVNADNSYWYQTFPVAKITKDMTNVSAEITAPSSINLSHYTKNSFDVEFPVAGHLLDESFIADDFEAALRYNRADIQSWTIKLSYGGKTISKSSPDVRPNQQYGKVNIAFPFDKSKMKKGESITIAVETTVTFYDGITNTGHTTKQIEITENPDNPAPKLKPTQPPKEPKPPLVCSPNLPGDAFDIVPYPASDSTDLSRVDYREVIVDGKNVDPDVFFSGNYVFGDGVHGLVQVSMAWQPLDGEAENGGVGCDTYRWVVVHDTKPRTQFKLNGGMYKENRKMSIDNTTADANEPIVLNTYPIVNYKWSYQVISGTESSRKMKVDNDSHKEFLYKQKGIYQIALTATNTLGRTSDPYVLDFEIMEDLVPAVVLHFFNSQIARGETVKLNYTPSSVDSDIIQSQRIDVYYDSKNDGSYDTLVETFNSTIMEYMPPNNRVGKYKVVATVKEEFGQETIPEFITVADKRVTVVENEFLVDNYIPYSDIYTDIPYNRQQVDLFMMADKNLTQSKINYVNANDVTINNMLREQAIDPKVNHWDMHTYTYSSPLNTTYYTGTSTPPSTYYYCSGGYCGTLNRTSYSDNGRNVDFGGPQTVVDVPGHFKTVTFPWCYYEAKNGQTYSHAPPCDDNKNLTTKSEQVWVPTTYKTVHVSDWRWVSSYTGFYSGMGYMDVRQAYYNPFSRTTSDKYVVYISDTIINELTEFNKAKNQSDAKIILVGNNNIKNQTAYDHFILNSGQAIEQIVKDVVAYIAEHNPPTAQTIVLLNERFNLYTLDLDEENDAFIRNEMMIVHDPNYFDNPMGRASFAIAEYDASGWGPENLINALSLPGKYTVYRRTQDRPSTDPKFASYNYFSNEARINIIAHRKPIAQAKLDWRYDPSCSCYRTTWVDESYDLDHQFSDPDKGIIQRKVKYQKNGGEWVYEIPARLDYGTYKLEYVVQDKELAWSDPFLMNFTLAQAPSIQLTAQARTELSTFSMSSIPASEKLRIYNIWSRYPYSHSLQIALYQGNTQRTTPLNVAYYTGTKSGDDIRWEDIVYTIPATAPDGNYMLRLTAIGQAGQQNFLEWPVTVNTPINLLPKVPTPGETIVTNQTYNLAVDTTKYATTVTATMFYGASSPVTRSFTSTQVGELKNWINSYLIPIRAVGDYTARFTATTPSGKSQTVDVPFILTNNRPPVADFDWTPQPVWEGDTVTFMNKSTDADGDPLTYMWRIINSSNTLVYTSAAVHPQYRLLVPDLYQITLTASDGKAATTVTRNMRVLPLMLETDVAHTADWLKVHQDKRHETSSHPKEYYSGERLMLSAVGSPVVTTRVVASINATGIDSEPIYVQTELTARGSGWYDGSLYDPIFSSLTQGLAKGVYDVNFRIDYANGVSKEARVPIRIIGYVQETVNVHRLQ